MRIAVIVPAAGASARYTAAGGLRSKLDEDLGGKPVIQRTVELFTKHDDVAQITYGRVDAGRGEVTKVRIHTVHTLSGHLCNLSTKTVH